MTAICHICHSDDTRYIFQSPLEKFTGAMGRTTGVDYYYCQKCTGLSQHPIFSDVDYKRFYELVQRSEETGYRSKKVPRWHLKQKQEHSAFKWNQMNLLDVPGLMPGKRVYEIGSGEGTLLATLRERGFSPRGIEPMALNAEYARNVLKLDVEQGYFNEQVAAREEADLVILDNVLEHLTRPYDMLRLVRGMISTGGVLYVAVPSAEMVTAENAHIAHITLWTRRALGFLMECAGFEVVGMLKGRPASRPHEWVCVAQATREPCPIETATPRLFPAIPFEELAALWGDRLKRYDRGVQGNAKYGRGFQMMVRLVRKVPGARQVFKRFL